MYSVVIPTMQGAAQLWDLVDTFTTHELVDEVLIVNNSDRELERPLPVGAREVYRGPNLYVNPAWNLGAAEATSEFLIIANDDIEFDAHLLDHVREAYEHQTFGMMGPSGATVLGGDRDRSFRTRPVWEVPGGYGVLLFLPRANYVPIPDSMRIYAGEYWLFWNQRLPNRQFSGSPIPTVMHTTSGRPEFERIKVADVAAYEASMEEVLGSQPWHGRALRHLWWERRRRALSRAKRRVKRQAVQAARGVRRSVAAGTSPES